MAAAFGHVQVVETLLWHGAEVNLQNSSGNTALMMAADQGHERVVDLLLRHRAEVGLQASGGHTALPPPSMAILPFCSACCGRAQT